MDDDAEGWDAPPLGEGDKSLAEIADWGPAEDWSDWAGDASGVGNRAACTSTDDGIPGC